MSAHRIDTGKLEEIKHRGIKSSISDDRPRPGNFMTLKIDNEPLELHRDVRLRDGDELIPPQQTADEENNTFKEEKGNERIQPQFMPEKDEVLSHKQEGDDRILPQLVPDDDETQSDKEKGGNRFSPQFIPDNDVALSEDQEGVELTPQIWKILYSKICQFEEARDTPLFNKRNYRVSVSINLLGKKMILLIVSSKEVHARALFEKFFSKHNGLELHRRKTNQLCRT